MSNRYVGPRSRSALARGFWYAANIPTPVGWVVVGLVVCGFVGVLLGLATR